MEEGQFLEDDFDSGIDLTPLIDVVFMLLLFFILVATFSPPVLQVALPTASTAAAADDPARLVLAIDAAGALHHGGAPITIEAVPELLSSHPDGAVELRVDRAAPFDAFIAVMDRLRAHGRSDVLITAKPE